MAIDLPAAVALVAGVYILTRLVRWLVRRQEGERRGADPDDTEKSSPAGVRDQDEEE